MKVSRAWLQTFFEEELPPAQELAELLTFHAFEIEEVVQVGEDWVIDVDVLPNRSSDCLSHRGIARELGTILERPLKRDPLREPIPRWEQPSEVVALVDDQRVCPRHMCAVLHGVTIQPSPEWLQQRLLAIGQRPINNVVDATNYITHHLGQPCHAFDLEKIDQDADGVRRLLVRNAHPDEEITTLGGATYHLRPEHIVIADAIADAPLDIAGVKGGTQAELTASTTDVILECANFHYLPIRKMSRDLKLFTDASLRFQNDVPRELPAFAMRDLITLITDIAGGVLAGVADVYDEQPENTPIKVTLAQTNTLLGTSLTVEDVEHILVRFEWEFSRSGETFAVTPSWERTDIHLKEEIIEEIGRIHGYRTLAGLLPQSPATTPVVNKHMYYTDLVRRTLAGLDYSEIYTYTLTDHGEVELLNPLASDKAFMRRDLATGVLGALELNARHAAYLGLDTVKIFEIGTIFREQGEVLHVALGARAVIGKQSKADTALMGDLAALAEALGMECTSETPQDGVVEFSLDALMGELLQPEGYQLPLPWNPEARYQPWSPYPCVYRDIAIWAPAATPAEEVLAVIVEVAPDLMVRHYQFDTFEKEGRVSYAWHLVFQSKERTLTDDDITPIMEQVTTALNAREGWEVR